MGNDLGCSRHPGLRFRASDEPHSSNIIVESTTRKESSSTGAHFASKEGNFVAPCADGIAELLIVFEKCKGTKRIGSYRTLYIFRSPGDKSYQYYLRYV